MKHLSKRPLKLLAAGLVAAGLGANMSPADAQAAEISGTILFAGGTKIPEGRVEIFLEDPAGTGTGNARAALAQVESSGGDKAITFALQMPAEVRASAPLQIVARLERADGWLLARGSAKVSAGDPVDITLFKAMY